MRIENMNSQSSMKELQRNILSGSLYDYEMNKTIESHEIYPSDFYDPGETNPYLDIFPEFEAEYNQEAPEIPSNPVNEEPREPLPPESNDQDLLSWTKKRIEDWERKDTLNWLFSVGIKLGLDYGDIVPELALPGQELLFLRKKDFVNYFGSSGKKLHNSLRTRHRANGRTSRRTRWSPKSCSDDECSDESGESFDTVFEKSLKSRRTQNSRKLSSGQTEERGRVTLPDFLIKLLNDERYCPRYIRWEDHKARIFRFVDGRKVAKLWGERNNKKRTENLTYEHFTRNIRHYYKKGLLCGRSARLVYKFGDMVTGLETDCPNFDPDYYTNRK